MGQSNRAAGALCLLMWLLFAASPNGQAPSTPPAKPKNEDVPAKPDDKKTAAKEGKKDAAQDKSGSEETPKTALTTEDTRLTVGLNSNIVSGSDRTFSFLFDFALTAPLSPGKVTRTHKRRVDAWGNIRLSGQPQTSAPSVKQVAGGFSEDVLSGKFNDVVEVADVLVGAEFRLPGTFSGGFNFGHNYQFQALAFVGYGFTTSPPKGGSVPTFELTDEARDRFIAPPAKKDDYKYIGFVQPDKRGFDQQYYAGLRFRTHHFKACKDPTKQCDPDARLNFPGTIDLSVGRNSALNGAALGSRATIFRLDAFYPLPTDSLANAVYLFGSADVLLHRPSEQTAVFLKPATVEVPSDNLYLYTLTPEDRRRDQWQFGVAVDLVRIFKGAGASPEPEIGITVPGPEVASNADLTIYRMTLEPDDKLPMASALDVLVPMTEGTLEVKGSEVTETKSLTAGNPWVLLEGSRAFKNIGKKGFIGLVVREKTTASDNPETYEWKCFNKCSDATTESKRLYVGPNIAIDQFNFHTDGTVTGKINERTAILTTAGDQKVRVKISRSAAPEPPQPGTLDQKDNQDSGKGPIKGNADPVPGKAPANGKGKSKPATDEDVKDLVRGTPLLIEKGAVFVIDGKKDASVILISLR